MSRREQVERMLTERKVSPEIVERVLRLSAPYDEGQILRGIHYASHDDPRFYRDCMRKGDFIRKYGRAEWDRLDRRGVFKRGRRAYVTRRAAFEVIQ